MLSPPDLPALKDLPAPKHLLSNTRITMTNSIDQSQSSSADGHHSWYDGKSDHPATSSQDDIGSGGHGHEDEGEVVSEHKYSGSSDDDGAEEAINADDEGDGDEGNDGADSGADSSSGYLSDKYQKITFPRASITQPQHSDLADNLVNQAVGNRDPATLGVTHDLIAPASIDIAPNVVQEMTTRYNLRRFYAAKLISRQPGSANTVISGRTVQELIGRKPLRSCRAFLHDEDKTLAIRSTTAQGETSFERYKFAFKGISEEHIAALIPVLVQLLENLPCRLKEMSKADVLWLTSMAKRLVQDNKYSK